jgi:hypothetical protein
MPPPLQNLGQGQVVQVDLGHYAPIHKWMPRIGDIVIWHGWMTHWFGVINLIQPNGHVSIIKSGMPATLFTMNQDEMQKSVVQVHYTKMQASRGGEWAVVQVSKEGTPVWHI